MGNLVKEINHRGHREKEFKLSVLCALLGKIFEFTNFPLCPPCSLW